LASREHWWYPEFLSFFDIFLELRQLQLLETVLDYATKHFEGTNSERPKHLDLEYYIFDTFIDKPRTMYSVFQIALKKDDQRCLSHLAKAMKKIDTLTKNHHNIAQLKYLIATVLFDKGQLDLGIQGWYQVFTATYSPTDNTWGTENYRERSLAHLVELCLSNADIPPSESFPITLGTAAESSGACLIISSWLQNHGDPNNARHALRGRVKACVALLSDDDPTNDDDAFISLFKTFMIDPGSEEDIGAVLYWIKQDNERLIKRYDDEERDAVKSKDEAGLVGSLGKTNLKDDSEGINSADSLDDLNIWFTCDALIMCSICTQQIKSIHGWYYCRSCPYKTCCRECSSKHPRNSNSPGLYKCPGVCDDEHHFFYTGGLLRAAERVPEGMIPVVSSDGDRHDIWIEDWKDGLAKKWETADFTFDGGLSAWCMRVLPEPQRTRWAKMFKV
jgi:hypothetical protein